jgi:hypothetical protein
LTEIKPLAQYASGSKRFELIEQFIEALNTAQQVAVNKKQLNKPVAPGAAGAVSTGPNVTMLGQDIKVFQSPDGTTYVTVNRADEASLRSRHPTWTLKKTHTNIYTAGARGTR